MLDIIYTATETLVDQVALDCFLKPFSVSASFAVVFPILLDFPPKPRGYFQLKTFYILYALNK